MAALVDLMDKVGSLIYLMKEEVHAVYYHDATELQDKVSKDKNRLFI